MSFQGYLDTIGAKTGKTPEQFKALAARAGVFENPNAAGLGRVNPIVPAKVRAKVDEAKKMLIAGRIKQK